MEYDSKIRFLERLLGKTKYHSNTKEAMFSCYFCSHYKPKLSINLKTDRWKCWVCGKHGNSLWYVLKQVGTREDIDEYFKKHKSKHVNLPYVVDTTFKLDLPTDFIPLVSCKNSLEGRKAWHYLTKTRGIDEEDILRHKIGISDSKILFPSFSKDGNLNMYQTRAYGGFKQKADVPRGWINQIVVNELNIDWSKPLVLTEGFEDMYKSIPNTVPLLGSSLMEDWAVFEKIVQHRTPTFLALDADAQKNSDVIAKKFIAWDVPVYNVSIDPYEDPGAMMKKQFLEQFAASTPVTSRTIYLNRLKAVCG